MRSRWLACLLLLFSSLLQAVAKRIEAELSRKERGRSARDRVRLAAHPPRHQLGAKHFANLASITSIFIITVYCRHWGGEA